MSDLWLSGKIIGARICRIELGLLCQAAYRVKAFFKLISLPFSTNDSDSVLDTQVKQCTDERTPIHRKDRLTLPGATLKRSGR
eukprot:2272880-Amphidinium_carterae.1